MWILILLLGLWLVFAVLGLVVKGLMWLTWVALILAAITLVVGYFAGLFTKD